MRRRSVAIPSSTRPMARAQRGRVARRHLEGGGVGHRLGRRAAGGADDGQAARHGLGQHHAVALVERRHDEEVGRGVQLSERRSSQRPERA